MVDKTEDEKLWICRPCGYVMKESELGDVCPACGLPRKVFEHYKERMSPGRRKILGLDMHPIAVHFPQTTLIFGLQALIINLIFPNFFPEVMLGTARFTAFIFPLTVIGAFVSGLIDGKIRFKSVTTPILKKKINWSIIMTIASFASPIIAWNGIDDLQTKLLLMLTGSISLFCGVVLGHIGKRLMNIGMGGAQKIFGRKI